VTFHVTPGSRDNIPVGDYVGYIEWSTVYLAGHAKRSMGRCVLHVERRDYPEFFSPDNSVMSVDVNVHADVTTGVITYDLIS